ncbi:site-2 protease family protein [Arcobacter sp. LA11]|uniref:site-2 protease family protein n=1 Tax=Arcobacter sp. LA11 TaxID=1898176 RepID=UPI000934F57C|nr:site-2 protease family protein [Arcobacter sp. LA11]
MNINFNTFLEKTVPYAFVILFAYVLMTIFSLLLPKNGIEFLDNSNISLPYQKYDGFYSNVKMNTPKIDKKIKVKTIETLSKYQLKAVYSTSNNGGWAIIQEKSSNKSTILEQYEKFNGYTLTKLYKKYIVFEKNLEEFKIELPLDKKVAYEFKNETPQGNENIIVNEDTIKVKRNYLNSYVNNLDKVWKDIAIKDIRKAGKIDGFKIDKVNKNSVFGKLGLKQNDVIKGINGNKINSYADAFKIYNEINKLEYLTIEVLRNNEIVELDYEID